MAHEHYLGVIADLQPQVAAAYRDAGERLGAHRLRIRRCMPRPGRWRRALKCRDNSAGPDRHRAAVGGAAAPQPLFNLLLPAINDALDCPQLHPGKGSGLKGGG